MNRRRRRSSTRKSCKDESEHHEMDECIAIMETTITDNISKNHAVRKGSALAHLFSYPVHIVSSACCWITLELGRLLEEKSNTNSCTDDPTKFLPSVVTFIIGLVLVKNYGDTLDSIITACLGSWGRVIVGFFDLLADLTLDDLEGVITAGVVLLFWIGAFRIVANTLNKLAEAPKLCPCSYSDVGCS